MSATWALDHCSRVTRAHSSTFFLGTRLLTPAGRRAVLAVYAVCRSGDDAVDEAPSAPVAAARLDAWWAGVERSYAGRPAADEPLECALAWVLERNEVPFDAFEELHRGLRSDLQRVQVDGLDELLVYCRRVGGVIGLMVAPIVGYRGGEGTLRDALALGQAMQLTNVLRDVGEDLARGRMYLPAEMMRRHGVHANDLHAGTISDGYVALLRELTQRANRLYRHGWRSIPKLRGTAAIAVGSAAINYQGILGKLERNGYDNLNRRAHLKTLERVALVPVAALRLSRRRLLAAVPGGSATGSGDP